MASCNACGSTIVFGGVTSGRFRFCNQKCAQRGAAIVAAHNSIPHDVVRTKTAEVFRGACPKCGGPGPVDMQMSYRVVSLVLMSRWSSRWSIACRSCGRKQQLADAAYCLLLGWWGFPWGLIMTPVQITRNLTRAFGGERHEPSPELADAVRLFLVQNPQAMQRPVAQFTGKLTS